MRICPFHTLQDQSFMIKSVSAVHQTPAYRRLDVNGRFCNGFMALECGECVYTWDTGHQTLHKGDIIYLPLGSRHRLEATSGEFSFYRIDFSVFDPNGEQIIFSKTPILFCRGADVMIMDTIKEMTEVFFNSGSFFQMNALLYRLLSHMETVSSKGSVREVIEYIQNNFTKDICAQDLESLCHLSRAQMYREFKRETGQSPIEYRNRLRIERAKTLLSNGACSVTEAASILGFENIYYFSRIFKKYTGLPPGSYAKQANRSDQEEK